MAKKTKLQIDFEFYFVWVILAILGAMPRRMTLFVCRRLFDIAYLIFGRLRHVALKNLEIAFPEKSKKEKLKIVRGCFHNLSRQVGELSQFKKATRESLESIIETDVADEFWQKYEEVKNAKRGLIFMTPHFGGWEILAFSSFLFIGPQSYLVRRLDNPRLEKMLADLRGKFGNEPLDKTTALMPALRLLRSGGNLGVLPDLNSQEHEGVFVPFFGKLACTTAGVAALSMRTNAIVVLLSAEWDDLKKKYVIRADAALDFESSGDRKQDIFNFTAKFTEEIEKVIRRNPEQWFWIHKRWKTRPEGEPEIY
jgi:KDO2-lipid IV(A) lauroyltransferase